MSKNLNIPNGDYRLRVQTGGTITLDTGSPDGRVVIIGQLEVNDLAVDDLEVNSPLLSIANDNQSDNVSIGFYGFYNDGVEDLKTGLFRNHVDKEYYLFDNYSLEIEDDVIFPNQAGKASLNVNALRADLLEGDIDGGTF